jgi:hypothetical protein
MKLRKGQNQVNYICTFVALHLRQVRSWRLTASRGLLLMLLSLGIATVGAAQAKPAYLLQMLKQYRLENTSSNVVGDVACTYCHIKTTGGYPWNPFGLKVRRAYREETDVTKSPESRIKVALYAALLKRVDSDQDGWYDALEVFANTLPGNKNSFSKGKVADLEAKFVKAGGVQRFQVGSP